MQWRFWRRWSNKKDAEESASEQWRADANTMSAWPANAGAKEILGLQQLVGNQAVLRLLSKDPSSANGESRKSRDRKAKRGAEIWNFLGWKQPNAELK